MKPVVYLKMIILLISLALLWKATGFLQIGFNGNVSSGVRIVNQIGGWASLLLCILGIVVLVVLIRRDKSFF